eukprot:TRINITY_DN67151_c4_g1_i2.p1 TRINITY_DN67151_c4_g1~~TRINITY_DN67151_c4_g1_i2.p1  ORF type:complete len:192 (-),score=3.62 TRINITY_DN67151_c4_g1_i2:983-1480(-)
MGDTFKKCMDSAKSGDPKSWLGLDQIDWGGDAAQVYACWKVEPCCGKPFNPKDCLHCLFQFYCCGLCTFSKICAYSVDQETALLNHCLLMYCCGGCSRICIRHNLRSKAGASGNVVGDFCCVWCCGPCAWCQELRSMPKEAWDILPALKGCDIPAVSGPEFKIMR